MLEKLLSHTKEVEGCLVWTRCFSTDGYPRMSIKNNANVKVHRLVYQLYYNEDITNKLVRHVCDNPKCINPKHLISGTATDNMLDRQERGLTHNFLPEKEVAEIVALRDKGLTYQAISNELGINRRRVEYALIKRVPKIGEGISVA